MHEVLREVPLFSVDLIDEGHYFVLEGPNGKVMGSGGWSQKMPSYKSAVAAAKPTFGRVAITRSVYVHPASARQGFGRRIMQHIETDAIDHGMTRMTMTATLSGMPLYRRIGYRVTDKQCAVLESGARVDLYGMEKSLIGENARAA
ncbi:MAG: GNAT family N-acetyltransferase [Silicimonas sp.]|nr:GNAT family N-acetyltransferase [Silicimonas sp.]